MGIPALGSKARMIFTDFDVPYPEKVSRGLTLVRLLFGIFYVYIPHGFHSDVQAIFVGLLQFLAWWVVLLLPKYPKGNA